MSTKALTLTIPAPLAQELDLASQEFLVEILERGLRELRIERALERYARGGGLWGGRSSSWHIAIRTGLLCVRTRHGAAF
jgi:hypothetical protein